MRLCSGPSSFRSVRYPRSPPIPQPLALPQSRSSNHATSPLALPFSPAAPGLDPSPLRLSLSPRSALALVAPAPSSSPSPSPALSHSPQEIGPGRLSALPHVANAAVPRSALPRRRHNAEPPPQGHPRAMSPPRPCPTRTCHSLLLGQSIEEEKMPPPHARCSGLHRALRWRRAPNRYAHSSLTSASSSSWPS